MVQVIIENEKVKVKSEYNKAFIRKAHGLKGEWQAPYWVFAEENEEHVRRVLMEIYGEDGTLPVKRVKVDVDIDTYEDGFRGDNAIYLDKLIIALRRYRDYRVDIPDNVIVLQGGFPASGGSAKYPCPYPNCGTVLRVTIPEVIYERVKDIEGISLVEEKTIDKKRKLQQERELLKKRLEEINEMLQDE